MSLANRLRKLEIFIKSSLSKPLQILIVEPYETKTQALDRCGFDESEIGVYYLLAPRPMDK